MRTSLLQWCYASYSEVHVFCGIYVIILSMMKPYGEQTTGAEFIHVCKRHCRNNPFDSSFLQFSEFFSS
jgi:hypothetical protein